MHSTFLSILCPSNLHRNVYCSLLNLSGCVNFDAAEKARSTGTTVTLLTSCHAAVIALLLAFVHTLCTQCVSHARVWCDILSLHMLQHRTRFSTATCHLVMLLLTVKTPCLSALKAGNGCALLWLGSSYARGTKAAMSRYVSSKRGYPGNVFINHTVGTDKVSEH